MNYKVIGILIAIVIVLIAIEFVVGGASAEENGSYVIVSMENVSIKNVSTTTSVILNQTSGNIPYNNNTRIEQGQCVEVGGVYDVSGVIGFNTILDYNAFAYYTRYTDAFDPSDNLSVSYVKKLPNNRIGYFQFFIDPVVFKDRIGYWYQYTGQFERAANKRAFYVSDKCIKAAKDTVFVSVNNTPILINPKVIDSRRVSDILVSTDDSLFLNLTGKYRIWAFGLDDAIISLDVNITPIIPTIDKTYMQTLTPDKYTLIIQSTGGDSRYGVDYTTSDRNITVEQYLTPSLRSQPIVDITGLQPKMIQEKLLAMLLQTDDSVVTYTMVVQEPDVQIDGYQELVVGNTSVLEVAGYTNKIPGTPITLYIDRDARTNMPIKYPAMTIMVDKGNVGDYRTFHGYLPLLYDEIPPGEHQLEAILPSGKISQVTLNIMKSAAPHYQQPVYYKWVDGHPFIPTPTPIIVEKEVIKEVTKVVINETTVYIPVDYNKLAAETLLKATPFIGGGILVGIPLLYVCLLAIRVFAERRTKNKLEVINDPKRTI